MINKTKKERNREMLKDTFLHTFRTGGWFIMEDWILDVSNRKVKLWNKKTDEEIPFKNLLDAYENAIVDGKPLKEIVKERDYKDIFKLIPKDGEEHELLVDYL